MKESIHIACASDERYFPGLLATVTSTLVNTDQEGKITFHIIDGGIKQDSWQFLKNTLHRFSNVEIFKYQIDQTHFEGFPDFFYDSKMAYARLLIPNLLSVSKVIYLDSDILFFKDVRLLWEMGFQGNAAMAALEVCMPHLKDDCPNINKLRMNPLAPYFNSGVLYCDLDRFRVEEIYAKTMKYLQNYPESCKFWDQSALNVILYNNFKLLDQSWNTQSHRSVFKIEESLADLSNFRINYHFVTSFKPWLNYNDSTQYRLFYALLEEMGYTLTNPSFLNSKKTYRQKMKLGKYMPLLYKIRAFKKKIYGQKMEAERDKKVAQFWQEQLSIINFQKKERLVIDKMETEWRKKIQESLLDQTIKV